MPHYRCGLDLIPFWIIQEGLSIDSGIKHSMKPLMGKADKKGGRDVKNT